VAPLPGRSHRNRCANFSNDFRRASREYHKNVFVLFRFVLFRTRPTPFPACRYRIRPRVPGRE
jgi:hypothetical protein